MHPAQLKAVRRSLVDDPRPSIVISPDYEVLWSNAAYQKAFGDGVERRRCYDVSHGYDAPCDQRGERCPLAEARRTRGPARVLHVHQTPRGPEHVDVSLTPLWGDDGELVGFIEHLTQVHGASARPRVGAQLGISRAFNAALELALRAAPTEVPVLVLGESGTGKERLAHAIHHASERSAGPFVAVSCSGLTESLFESELFGHEKGAFTGAHARKAGLVETAAGGTLFLDEIGDIPLSLQVKLLRLLESGTFRRVGGTQSIRADFRLVSATWRDLSRKVGDGTFRQDLYFRISAFPIEVPPLRERLHDLELLVTAILSELGAHAEPTERAWEALRGHPWPGNVRELRNVLHRASILAHGQPIDVPHLSVVAPEPDEARAPAPPPSPHWGEEVLPLDEMEARYLEWCLKRVPNRAQLAAQLGIGERTLYRKLARLREA